MGASHTQFIVTSHAYGISPRPGFSHAPKPRQSVCTQVMYTFFPGVYVTPGFTEWLFLNVNPGVTVV